MKTKKFFLLPPLEEAIPVSLSLPLYREGLTHAHPTPQNDYIA